MKVTQGAFSFLPELTDDEIAALEHDNAERHHKLAAEQTSNADKLEAHADKLEAHADKLDAMGHALEAKAVEIKGDTLVQQGT